jgi:hypothetical protein
MPDVPMPEEMIAWMRQRNWSAHHQQWHFVRRWELSSVDVNHDSPANPAVEDLRAEVFDS